MNSYKVALITGATGGIGSAIAHNLVANGMKVILSGRNNAKLNKLSSELGDSVVYCEALDLSDYEAMKTFVYNIKEKDIKVDTLINNAGLALDLVPFQEYNPNDIITMLDTNVKAVALLSNLLLPSMVTNNHGIIINIGSIAGQYAYPNGSVYCASKAAIETLSDGIRVDVMASDVKVTNIMPGLVETDFSLIRFKGDKAKADKVYQGIEALQPEDVADAVWFVINQPRRVQIGELSLLANQQGNGFINYKK
ncbi:MAG: SDR family NAD(P)-dependent oxidoreductase [Erysipelotrichales bacterium]